MEGILTQMKLQWKSDTDERTGTLYLKKSTENLIHNLVSVLAVIALINGSSKIEPKHLLGSKDYLYRKCPLMKSYASSVNNQRGGSVFPAGYFNADPNVEPMYQAGNIGNSSADTIDFVLGTARAAISQTGGSHAARTAAQGSPNAFHKWMKMSLNQSLEHHKVSISKMATEEVMLMIKHLLSCLLKDISKKTPISAKRVQKVLSKKAYGIFH
jgi:hypothetical protein